MNPKPIVPVALFITTLSIPVMTEAASPKACPINKSIYRDGDGQGYQLVFGPPPPKGIYHATAVIQHPQYGQLYRFTVSQSSGYGSVSLAGQYIPNSKRSLVLWITFFDQTLKSATPLFLGEEKEAPQYAVIAELGGYDHYRRRDEMRDKPRPPLRDPIWIFDRCQ